MSEASTVEATAAVDRAMLKKQLRRHERGKQMIALALVAPLFLYLAVNFVIPVAVVLFKSVDDREVTTILHRTTEAISAWDGTNLPGNAVFAALVADLREARAARTLFVAAKRLNSARSGFQALLGRTGRKLAKIEKVDTAKDTLIRMDKRWGQQAYWSVIKRSSKPYTFVYLLSAFDLTIDENGDVVQVPERLRVFNAIWLRTFWMGFVITLLCVVMGYPLAYVMASVSPGARNILMILVLIPFWTALLVRTTAWIVLLQNQGVINDLGLFLNLWSERVQLIHNRMGVYVAMTHILLPFMVLPLYAIMRRIPPAHMRAAKSLGATPLIAFLKVYWPQTRHGVGAGALFVYILAVGFYVTPALVGGPNDQMISWFIAFYANESLNWGAAAALSTMLLLFKGVLYYLVNVAFRLGKMKL